MARMDKHIVAMAVAKELNWQKSLRRLQRHWHLVLPQALCKAVSGIRSIILYTWRLKLRQESLQEYECDSDDNGEKGDTRDDDGDDEGGVSEDLFSRASWSAHHTQQTSSSRPKTFLDLV